jgi:hypothetical protein
MPCTMTPRSLRTESLEPRRPLTAIGFMTHEIARNDLTRRSDTAILVDFDGDGDQDLLTSSDVTSDGLTTPTASRSSPWHRPSIPSAGSDRSATTPIPKRDSSTCGQDITSLPSAGGSRRIRYTTLI